MDTETILTTARFLIEDLSEKVESPEADRLDFYLTDPKNVIVAAAGLRVKHLGYLAAITGIDPGIDQEMLEVLYHFCADYATITLRVNIPKAFPNINTLTEIIPSAEPFERELSEMFGIKVVGLRNTELLYLPDDWSEGFYPLRKDFQPQIMDDYSLKKVYKCQGSK